MCLVPGLDVRVVKSGLPAPIAHYTEAFVVGDLVYAAGQLATDFKTGIPENAKRKAELSVLRFRHQAADRIHPQEPGDDFRRGWKLPGQRRQSAGVLD